MNLVIKGRFLLWVCLSAVIVAITEIGLVFGLEERDEDEQIVAAVVSNGIGCAEIGRQMLSDDGSAVDAAIAILLCEGVMLTQSMGLGGGFMATVYSRKTKKMETLNARETAPAAAYKDMFVGETKITGARSGAVPGELLGYWELHQRYGRLPWRTLFQPTIKLCKEGHYVSEFMARVLRITESEIRSQPSMAEVFVKEDGTLYKEGDYLKRTVLGQTLEKIADNGAGEMYDGGSIGRMFAEDIQEMGGIITEQDLINYTVKWEDANVATNLTDEYQLFTTPLPSSGMVLVFILNVIGGLYTNNEELFWHRVVETYKHAYGLRTSLGDIDNDPEMYYIIKEASDKLLSQEFANSIRQKIHDDKTFNDLMFYGANFSIVEDHGTANVVVLAENGDAISITSTINNYFGAKVRSRRTGIILNDEMDDFSTPGVINSFGVPASPANFIKPGKRPLSSMCPAIILDKAGDVQMVVGAAGGTKITTTVAMTIIKYLFFNQTLEESVNGPRMHHQLAPIKVEAEVGIPLNIRTYLETVGHVVNISSGSFAAVTAIGMRNGSPEPTYDLRRSGSTAILTAKKGSKAV